MFFEVRIVILNYNGRDIMEKCLPSVVEAAAVAQHPTTITVLDNRSSDGSEKYVLENFPNVAFWKAQENKVLCSYNDYLREIKEPVAILLNNDIKVDPGFVDPLVEEFKKNDSVFLVAPRVHSFDGREMEAADIRSKMKFGMFWISARYPGYEAHAMVPGPTVSAGFGAFDREKFLRLGGYDALFMPGIFEDIDLCYRAAAAGFSLHYEPRSLVYHMGQASFKKAYSTLKRETIAYRNTFLFMWKNLHGAGFWIPHLFFLPFRIIWALLKGRPDFLLGLLEALGHPKKSSYADPSLR